MYAVFRNQRFAHFVAAALTGPATQPTDAEHRVALPEEQRQRVRAIYQSGFEAEATFRGKGKHPQLVISPTTARRTLQLRVSYGSGSALIKNLHTLSLAAGVRRIQDEADVELSQQEAQDKVKAAVRGLLTAHPAPTQTHLVETFVGLWPQTHTQFQATLKDGLLAGLTEIVGAEAAAQLTAQAVLHVGKGSARRVAV